MTRRHQARGTRHDELVGGAWSSLLALSCFLLVLALAIPARAHERTVSYSSWEIDGARARVTVRLSALDVSRLPWAATAAGAADLDRRLGDYLVASLTMQDGSQPCAISQPPVRLATGPDRLAFRWEVSCPGAERLTLHSQVLHDVATGHLHFARVRRDGGTPRERVLSEESPNWNLSGDAPPSSFSGYVGIGIEHILTGYDHLVFLLGLLLLGGTLRDVVRIVTGFTVAHSLTLALAVFGVVRPPGRPIEALIGLSIALVAAENLWLAARRPDAARWAIGGILACLALASAFGRGSVPALTLAGLALFTLCYFGLLERVERPAPLRTAIAFLFGLVHGFGFAGVLLDAELPTPQLALALFGFNLGVELGQVAAVIALWPVLSLVSRWQEGRIYQPLVEYGSAAILAVGAFWFVSRSYG